MSASLQIDRVEVSFGPVKVLKGVSLDVQPGEFVALLGSSGCGKTTLLRAISGFVAIESGAIRVDGADRRARAGIHHAALQRFTFWHCGIRLS